MSENHQFHRPNLRPKRNRSGVSDLVNQTSQLISQIKDKSPFLQKKNHKSPSKNSRNGGISSDDPIRLSLPSNGDEKKERRKSAPPNVDKLMVRLLTLMRIFTALVKMLKSRGSLRVNSPSTITPTLIPFHYNQLYAIERNQNVKFC